jgi:hypothetical protein
MATAAPEPGAGAAIKTLSARIAQGMLFQAAQERARLQQQQQDPEHHHHHHHQQQQQQTDGMQSVPAPSSSCPATAAAAGPGQSPPWEACLSVLQRLEAKVDHLAVGVTAGLQQLDQRLAKLEACAAGAVSH